MEIKTQKILDKLNLPVEIVEFDTKGTKGVIEISQKLGVKAKQVVKTLVLKGKSEKFYMCIVGGDSKLNYKALKKLLSEKDVVMAKPDEIKVQTGYDLGAIPAFGLKNDLKTIIASNLKELDKLYVGTGVYGYDFVMSPNDLVNATNGTFKEVIKMDKDAVTKNIDINYEVEHNPMKEESKFDEDSFITVDAALLKGEGDISLRGWVYRIRNSNAFVFIVLRDQTNIIQCVVKKEDFPKLYEEAIKLTNESSLKLTGTIKKDDRAPTGYEVQVNDLEIVQVAMPFPITKDFSPEFLLDNRHLWIRSRKMTAILKIRHTVVGAIHEFFRNKGFYEFSAPIFQPNACEGGSTLFEVKYFKDKVYLAQSWQLYAEAGVFALGKIYNMSPTFRSEKSKTSRHLAEFWMAEMEAAWMELEDVVQIGKDELKFIVKKVLKDNLNELKILGRDIEKLKPSVQKDYPTVTYTQALKLLKEKQRMDVKWGKDLRTIEEEKLMELFDTPVAVVDYPKEVMAFYKKRRLPKPKESPADVALCFDMLAPEGYGEIIGGSQRDTNIHELMKYLKAEGEDPKNYDWYLDLRKYGSVPHSGYGLGVERVVRWICGVENIKDTIPFPRTMLRKTP